MMKYKTTNYKKKTLVRSNSKICKFLYLLNFPKCYVKLNWPNFATKKYNKNNVESIFFT